MIYPGLAIMVTVLAFNLLGDGIREALDPRQKRIDDRGCRRDRSPGADSRSHRRNGLSRRQPVDRVPHQGRQRRARRRRPVLRSADPARSSPIVGESGSGKSVTSLSIMGLIPSPPGRIAGGAITFDGRDLTNLSDRRDAATSAARRLSMIFQEPMTSLNPVLSIGRQMTEGIIEHLGPEPGGGAQARRRHDAPRQHPRARAAAEGIPAPVLGRHAAADHDRHRDVLPPAAC